MSAPICECCGSPVGVEPEPSRTCYEHVPGEPDPNRDIMLCRECAVEHHQQMDDQWAAARGY